MQVYNKIQSYFAVYGLKEFTWLVVCAFLLIPQALLFPLEGGLDPSWRISIGLAIEKDLIFGKDYIFTLGPLGFLATKYAIGISKWHILLYEIFMIGSSLYIIRFALKSRGYHILCYPLILWILILLKANNLINLITPVLLFFIASFLNRRKILFLILAVMLTSIAFYVKVNYGIVLLVIIYGTLLVAVVKKVLTTVQAIGVVILHTSLIYLLSLYLNVHLFSYVEASLYIIDHYHDAMYFYMQATSWRFLFAVIILLLYLTGFLIYYRHFFQNLISFAVYAFSGLYLFLLFKNGFVRAGGEHVNEFYKLSVVPFVLVWLFEKEPYKKTWITLIGCAVLSSSLALIFKQKYFQDISIDHYINKEYFTDIVTDVSHKQFIPEEARSEEKFPDAFVKQIGKSSVDVIPYEISEIHYHKMNYNPRPMIQSYQAYDEYLDNRNFQKYISANSPEYLIYKCISIDFRQPFWDESITKRAMLSHYEVVNSDSLYLLLKKRKQPLKLTTLQETKTVLEIGKEYKIKDSEDIQYLYANVEYNIWGKLKRLFFQPPPLHVVLTYEDGTSITYKAISSILKTGVLINRKVEDTPDAELIFRNTPGKGVKVTSLLLKGEYGFDGKVEAVIKEVAVGK